MDEELRKAVADFFAAIDKKDKAFEYHKANPDDPEWRRHYARGVVLTIKARDNLRAVFEGD